MAKKHATELLARGRSAFGRIGADQLIVILPYALIAVLFTIFAILHPRFANFRNVTGMLTIASVLLLVAAGETFVILMGSIDLSIGAMLSSSAIMAAYFFPYGGWETVVAAIGLGLVSGLINGCLIVWLRLPSFIITLAMMFAYKGIATALTSGYNIAIRSNQFSAIAHGELIPGVPNIILWALIAFVIFWYVSERTRAGRYIYALGGNEPAVRTMGISANRYRVLAFAMSGLLNGIACVLLSSFLGMAPARLGDRYLFNALIAVVIGGTSIMGGAGGLRRTLIGVLVIVIFDNGAALLGIDSRMQEVAKGVLLIVAVFLTVLSAKRRGKLVLTK